MKILLYLLALAMCPIYGFTQGGGYLIRMSENPVIIDADYLFPFSDGYAVIQKGDSHALIDRDGKIVIAYNVYKFSTNKYHRGFFMQGMVDGYGFLDGKAKVFNLETKKNGVLNTNLRLVLPCEYHNVDLVHHSGYIYAVKNTPGSKQDFLIFNESGELVKEVDNRFNHYSDSIIPGVFEGGKYGYRRYFGETVIAPQFDRVKPFSDGMAAVAKNNEFGELKWGFINDKGEQIIPFNFSKEPGDFHEGMALVEPVVKDQFKYAYLNKNGKVVFTIQDDEERNFSPSNNGHLRRGNDSHRKPGSYIDGYSIWFGAYRKRNDKTPIVFFDKLGNGNYYINMLQQHGWSSDRFIMVTEFINKEAIIATKTGFQKDDVYAIANLDGEIIIKTGSGEKGTLIQIESLFDPVSNLASVTLFESKEDWKGKTAYVNRSGEIVMLMGDPQIW